MTSPRYVLQFPFRAARSLWRIAAATLRSFRFWLLVGLAVIVLLIAYYAASDRYTPMTTDAFVQAYVVQVAPQVGAQVVRVHVAEGDSVEKGALLFELDPRPFEHKVALWKAKLVEAEQQVRQLKTQLLAARAEHERLVAEATYARLVYEQEERIYKKESTTERKYQDATQKHQASVAAVQRSAQLVQHAEEALDALIDGEHNLIAQAKAQLAEARLNLSYTKIHAPCTGTITNLQLREGAYAHVGQPVLACIDTSQWVIVANFREDCLTHMQAGQPALVAFRQAPGRLFAARVESIGSGVSQGQGTPSGQLPDVKNQSSWIPLSQRFQVRLALTDSAAVRLRVGLTGSVSVYTRSEGFLNDLTNTVHRILAWFYYL